MLVDSDEKEEAIKWFKTFIFPVFSKLTKNKNYLVDKLLLIELKKSINDNLIMIEIKKIIDEA